MTLRSLVCRRQAGDHLAALRLLAVTLHDLRGAEAYCRDHPGVGGYGDLLDMLLRPGDDIAPRYAEACHVISVAGPGHSAG